MAFSGQFSYFEALFERNDYHTEIISCCLLEAKKPIIFKKRERCQIWPRATRYFGTAPLAILEGKIENVLTLKSDLVMKL